VSEGLDVAIEEAAANCERLKKELRRAQERLLVLKKDLAKRDFGVEVGSVVNYKGIEHRVTDVDPRWRGKPWLSGNPRKKNGEFGVAIRHLYSDWETT